VVLPLAVSGWTVSSQPQEAEMKWKMCVALAVMIAGITAAATAQDFRGTIEIPCLAKARKPAQKGQ